MSNHDYDVALKRGCQEKKLRTLLTNDVPADGSLFQDDDIAARSRRKQAPVRQGKFEFRALIPTTQESGKKG
jgi:hypothetical protein